ncbi:putative RNA-directed DNA polymerase [Helianthus annuus]|nr:putative RNA-directed DNA polymerase [Helianthus annuus]
MATQSSPTSTVSETFSNSSNNFPNITNLMPIKLDDTNFLNWQHQTLTILKTLGLLQFLNQNHTPPVDLDARAAWEKVDAYVSAFITANLSTSLIHIARGTISSSDLWQRIEDLFHQQAFANKNLYRTKFHSLKQDDKTVLEFCDSAKKLFDSLQAIGDPITEENLVLQILNGLHPDYRMFVTNIENQDIKPTYCQLRAKLLTYEARLKQSQSVYSTTVPIAAMAAMNINQTAPHQSNLSSPSVVCQICDKSGHKAVNCYQRFSPATGGRSTGGRWRSNRGRRGGFTSQRGGFTGQRNGQSGNFAGMMPNYGGNKVSQIGGNVPVGFDGRIFGSENYNQGILGPGPSNVFDQTNFTGPHTKLQQNVSANSFGPAMFDNQVGPGCNQFGPNHFAQWAGMSNGKNQNNVGQTSTSVGPNGPHFGIMADLSTICDKVDSWIPDSGATAHMTADSSLVLELFLTLTLSVLLSAIVHARWTGPPPHAW